MIPWRTVDINREQLDGKSVIVLGDEVHPGTIMAVFGRVELLAFIESVAQATLDWWDFDGSYREANDFDGEIDVMGIARHMIDNQAKADQ